MSEPTSPISLHASVVTVGEAGILIEGPSGSGKSTLAGALTDAAAARGGYARLVGDDRVDVAAHHGRLLARPHPAIAGLIERRGVGLVPVAFEPAAVIRLAVRLATNPADAGERLPAIHPTVRHCGVILPLLVLRADAAASDNARRIFAALAQGARTAANKLANSPAMHKIAPHDAAAGMLRDQLER